ncbi:DUF3667 domain-containing protein [Flavihumibacter sp. R14]|nr:DUF3667 domain-containing protein [Flavihumibacter soli]
MNFCPYCGQKKEVGKLTWHSLVLEIFHFFSHIEKGFLNTSYQIIIRPGKVISEYLEGKRKKYFKPLSLYLIWFSVHLITFNLLIQWMHYENHRTTNFLFAGGDVGTFIVRHNNIFGLLLLPILSLLIWLIVSKPWMNYLESFILGIYAFAAFEILIVFQILITGLLFRTNFLTDGFLIQIQVVSLAWSFFCFLTFFKSKKIKFLIPRILLGLVLGIIVYQKITVLIANLILKIFY